MGYSRRSFVKAGVAGATLTALPFTRWLETDAYAGVPLIRYNAYSAEGKEMLAQYAKAVAIMKKRRKGDPCGWTFQWFTHWVRGDSTKPVQVASLPTSQQALANAMWNTCQNHGGFTTEDMFLPWHRMYVLYFERIVRKTLNDPTWTLPYWNYNDPAQASLPSEFITPSSASNPLWVSNRNSGPNSGSPLSGLNLNALSQTAYSSFCSTLDFGLHGSVHVQVGNAQNMGSVPWAANDPVFWMHHSNIDRLWASWNAAGYTNPTDADWIRQTFVFADECCRRVVARVGDFGNISNLHYAYDRLEPVKRATIKWPLWFEALRARPLLKGPGRTALGSKPVTVHLSVPSGGKSFAMQEAIKALPGEQRLFLAIGGLMTQGAPGVVFDIYLDLQGETSDKDAAQHLVGSINFFAADMPAGARPMKQMPGLVFDVTELLARLNERNRLTDKHTVTIAPVGQPARNARSFVGEITFIQQ